MVKENRQNLNGVFHALADPTRRAMLRRLAAQKQTVTELAEPFDMSLAAASKHVKVLERAGLIRRTIDGRTHICSLNPDPLADAREWLRYYERFWNESLDALERALHEPEGGPDEDVKKRRKK